MDKSIRKPDIDIIENRGWDKIFNALPDFVFIQDSNYIITRANTAFAKLVGMKPKDIVGKKCYSVLHGRKSSIPNYPFSRTKKNRRLNTVEFDEPIYNRRLSVTTSPIFNGKRTISSSVHVATDITERKKAEEAVLNVSRFSSENPNPVLRINSEGKILYKNDAASSLLRKAKFRQKDIVKILPKDLASRITQALKTKKLIYDLEASVVNKVYSYSLVPVPGTNYVNLYGFDIIERKKTTKKLKKYQNGLEKDIQEKIGELISAQRELESARRLSDIGTLAATVAHELRNPLGVIKVALYNIRQKQKGQALISHLDNSGKKISESDQIIKNLLSYSKIMMPHFENVNFVQILMECIADCKQKCLHWDVVLKLKHNCRSCDSMVADSLHLKELISNILDNACQSFAERKGMISIKVNYLKLENRVIMYFRDQGVGMDKIYLSKVFEPFFTLKSKGIGLGLTVCRQVVSLHNGKIKISSRKGKGTVVYVSLPLSKNGDK